jgi:multiple sugar transport system substrate-binding protein
MQLQRVKPIPKVAEVEIISSKLIEASEAAIRGHVPPQRALESLDRDVDQILEKRRWILGRESRTTAGNGNAEDRRRKLLALGGASR